ncbi:hypothetical protein [Brevundimonas sp. SL130]|uniref:hypothetical protein n=1 Tax=Brevundimonas sp. SL130 TaxID=2995143 RepID=UPI00226D0DB3|nr:hypothetical protein [Brevundimonas sp. SL130]WAC59951.1 hypothetical protein OU998_00470 [Brevundimonas sp. SL130]
MIKPVLPVRKRFEVHTGDFLSRAKNVRVALQSAAVAMPVLIAIAKAVETSASGEVKAAAVAVQIVLLIVAAACGILVLLTDKSALAIMADATDALDQVDKKDEEIKSLVDEADLLKVELTKQVQSSLTVEVMRQAVDSALLVGRASDLKVEMIALLDLLVASKATLFGMGDEQWNFSIYLWDKDTKTLVCSACRRPTKADEDGEHRNWLSGEGHVGKAFSNKRSIIVSDALDPNVRGFFDAPLEKRAADEGDAIKYRSIVAIPIALAGAPADAEPLGVVVATSDQAGRFTPREDGTEDDAVKPIRHLGNTIATLLAFNDLSRRD